MSRVYLDWNATAPLRPEARAAMIAAMDVVGNPSSVHAEGRAAKGVVETARGQVAKLVWCEPDEIVFTSGATEAVSIACQQVDFVHCTDWEHDCVVAWREATGGGKLPSEDFSRRDLFAPPCANGETGVLEPVFLQQSDRGGGAYFAGRALSLEDVTQQVGKAAYGFSRGSVSSFAAMSSHKLGGPKGSGALLLRTGTEIESTSKGGGQEMGRRSGTENVIGIAGFGAAAEAARRDLADGVWDRVAELRNRLEDVLLNEASDIIIFGKEVARLPNTSCFAIPGWKGETQVMQMDLAGYAVSAGSACSSGKVKESRVLRAMGFDSVTASSAIRVSMGPTTTEDEVMGFARTWIDHYRRYKARAA